MLHILSPFLLFAAFILLLFTSLSLPIIKSIYLLQLTANLKEGISIISADVTGQVRFGVWGYCVSPIDISALGQHVDTTAQCTPPHLGYTFDNTVANALHVDDSIETDLVKSLTNVLVLHPVACGLAFVALLTSLAVCFRPAGSSSRAASVIALAFTSLATVFATIAFLVDVIGSAVISSKIHEVTDGVVTGSGVAGNVIWLTFGAMIALWFASVGTCCGICACGRRRTRTKFDNRY